MAIQTQGFNKRHHGLALGCGDFVVMHRPERDDLTTDETTLGDESVRDISELIEAEPTRG